MRLDNLRNIEKIGGKISLNDEKGYVIAVLLALVIISAVAVTYFVFFRPAPSGYSTIYLLDSQNKAVNYPEVLIANQNSTFTVPVAVINNMGSTVKYQVLVKITTDLTTLPVNTQPLDAYDFTLGNGQNWQKSAPITENQVGSYSVVFELWQHNNGAYEFTYDYCVLNIQVIS